MKTKQVFDTLEAFALLVKENHALRESNKRLNDYVSSLESDVNYHLQENKGLKAEIKELEERIESVNHLANLHLKCLEQVREENESLKEENKGLKRDVCKRDEFIDNNVEVLRQENKDLVHQKDELIQANTVLKDGIRELKAVNQLLEQGIEDLRNNIEKSQEENKSLKEDRDELLEQLKKETAPFEKQVIRLMLENRRLTKQLEEAYELHALKGELQKELKEQNITLSD